jgi:hypothetical protein
MDELEQTPTTLTDIYDALEAAQLTAPAPAPAHGAPREQWDAWREDRAQYYGEQAELWAAVSTAPDLRAIPAPAQLLLVMAAGGHAWSNRAIASDLRRGMEDKGAPARQLDGE